MVYRSLYPDEGLTEEDVTWVLVVEEPSRTRNTGFKKYKFRFRKKKKKNLGKNWFASRVVEEWNRLSNHAEGGITIEVGQAQGKCVMARLD